MTPLRSLNKAFFFIYNCFIKQLLIVQQIINLKMFPNIMYTQMVPYPTFYYPYDEQPQFYAFDQLQPEFYNYQPENQNTISEVESDQDFKFTLSQEDIQKQGTGIAKKHWSQHQDNLLKQYVAQYVNDWSQIAKMLPGRNQKMCYSRYRRIQNDIKSNWTDKENEDIKRMHQVQKISWNTMSEIFPNHTAKQIRQHYLSFLRPNISRSQWTIEQDLRIVKLYNQYGKKWKKFEKQFQGRTQNQIKNRFYGRLRRLEQKKQSQQS